MSLTKEENPARSGIKDVADISSRDDFLLPVDTRARNLARELYASVYQLPIISPHGHCDPGWFACDEPFSDPTSLILTPDHYLLRMLHSQGVSLAELGVSRTSDEGKKTEDVEFDPRAAWRLFAEKFYIFRGTPSGLWLERNLSTVFGIDEPLSKSTADAIYDNITTALRQPAFRPRALFERFNIEFLATTDHATDSLAHHKRLAEDSWPGRVAPTYRPDDVTDPENVDFLKNIKTLGELTGQDTMTWKGYLEAHRLRRQEFMQFGATATDHGHPSVATADLGALEAEALYFKLLTSDSSPQDAELFRAQMLTEMARMSLDDGMVMQVHPGPYRNHSPAKHAEYGPDIGFDIPRQTEYVHALKPLLNRFGNEPRLSIILFTLDESAYSRELAPLAGVYPALKLGPAWWFHDSPAGMMRYREQVTEIAGFYNTVGFTDDTRVFMSIPVRHDVARRIDCSYLAKLVIEQRLGRSDAFEVAHDLAYALPKSAYRIDA